MGVFNKIFSNMCQTEENNIITKFTDGFFDPYYNGSPYVIVTEVPFLGMRFSLGKLKFNNKKSELIRDTEEDNSEFFELYDESDKNAKVLSYRFKELHTKPGLKIRFWYCINYHIVKDGIIKEKDHDVVTKDSNINIKFTTLYKYHLVDPKKFLSVYENRERVYKDADIWDIMQRDIRLRLDKKIMDYIINCDYQELITTHNNLRFEEILLRDKLSIINEFGIYIDEAYVTDLLLPEDILKEAQKIEANRLRRDAQIEGAKLDAKIDAEKQMIQRAAARDELVKDVDLLGKLDPEAFSRYIKRNYAKNLKAAAFGPNGIGATQHREHQEKTIGSYNADFRTQIFNFLFGSSYCDSYGVLTDSALDILASNNSNRNIPLHLEDLTLEQFKELKAGKKKTR